jgi:precorrin-4 C11-methyltransferase
LTLKAARILREAEVVVWTDSLLPPDILSLCPPEAEKVGSSSLTLEEMGEILCRAAEEGRLAVRLHTGDPAFFSALGEEVAFLRSRGVSFEVVPGVSSASAAAASLGVELTRPGVSQTVVFTRVPGRTPVPEGEKIRDFARSGATLAFFLSAGLADRLVRECLEGGLPPETPAAVVHRASWPEERVFRTELARLPGLLSEEGIKGQALILVGRVLGETEGEALPSLVYSRVPPRRHHLMLVAEPGHRVAERLSGSRDAGADEDLAVLALTGRGARRASRLARELGASLHLPERLSPSFPGSRPFSRASEALASLFPSARGLILFLPVGAAVRLLSPLLRGKGRDPAVVVADEDGEHVISFLSGHRGANELARRVARLLGGRAVITTASDRRGLPSLEEMARVRGWRVEGSRGWARVLAALLEGEPVGVWDETEADWTPFRGRVRLFASKEELAGLLQTGELGGAVWVTDRSLLLTPRGEEKAVFLRPPTLAAGAGLHRGVDPRQVADGLRAALAEAGYSLFSLFALGLPAWRAEERREEWEELARELGVRLFLFSREDLLSAPAGPSPSYARRGGLPGVAEPCALLAGVRGRGSGFPVEWVVPKRKGRDFTLAVARFYRPESRG